MKKAIITLCLFFFISNSFSQTLSQKDFDLILKEVKSITANFESPKDCSTLAERLNLNNEESKKLTQSFKNKDLIFNDLKSNNYILPFFTKSQNDQFLFLNLAVFTSHSLANKEAFPRSTYYFTFYCYVGVVNNKVVFKGAKILNKKDIIHKWFLSLYPNYLKETKVIHEKYGFIPPLPFPAPIDLEHKRN